MELAHAHRIADPSDTRFDGKMLWCIYNNGDATLQKAGVLWGGRNEHLIHWGWSPERRLLDVDTVDWSDSPQQEDDEEEGDRLKYVIVEDESVALAVRQAVLQALKRAYPPPSARRHE